MVVFRERQNELNDVLSRIVTGGGYIIAPKAVFHGDLAYRYNPEPASQRANNLGYLYLVLGNLKRAR